MKSLGIFNYKNISTAYKAYNDLTLNNFEVLEISPMGGAGQILTSLSHEAFINHSQKYVNELEHRVFLEVIDPRILDAYLSLKITPLKEGLLILENVFLGEIFGLAKRALELNLEIVDLRLFRGEKAKCVLFLTAHDLSELANFEKEILDSSVANLKVVFIDKISKSLKDLFS